MTQLSFSYMNVYTPSSVTFLRFLGGSSVYPTINTSSSSHPATTAQLYFFIHLEKWHGEEKKTQKKLILQENCSLCHHLVVLKVHMYKMRGVSYV